MSTFSHIVVFLVISVAVLLPKATVATEYVVGGDSGWTIDFDYQSWAKNKQFYVGDTLVFKYMPGMHDVYKVNASSFANCTLPAPSLRLASGHDVVTLQAPGKKWYICGVERHCADHNQKLVINVQGWTAPAPAPNSATKYGHQAFMVAIVVVLAAITMF